MALVTKIRAVGNSKGIILPQAVLDQMNWTGDSEVEIQVKGATLVLVERTARTASKEEFAKAKNRVFTQHRELNKRLANR